MTARDCPRSDAVVDAVRSGEWTDELRAHVASCADCSELALVSGFIARHAAEMQPAQPLLDPRFVWWRAQLRAHSDAAERVARIIGRIQTAAALSTGALGVLVVMRFWPQIAEWTSRVVAVLAPSSLPADMAPPWLVIAASLGLLAMLILMDPFETRTKDRP